MSSEETSDLIHMDIPSGRVVIRLRPDLALQAAERIQTLAAQGFYDNVPFHRVIPGFMAQGGDPTGTGMHGSDLPDLPAEFTRAARFERGTIGMARTSHPNSANSQFFIMFEPSPHLDGQYTIVGEVVEGMENVDKIKRGSGMSGVVNEPDRIAKMVPADKAEA